MKPDVEDEVAERIVDIDVAADNPAYYPDLPTALAALTAFCNEAGIAQPTHHEVFGLAQIREMKKIFYSLHKG